MFGPDPFKTFGIPGIPQRPTPMPQPTGLAGQAPALSQLGAPQQAPEPPAIPGGTPVAAPPPLSFSPPLNAGGILGSLFGGEQPLPAQIGAATSEVPQLTSSADWLR